MLTCDYLRFELLLQLLRTEHESSSLSHALVLLDFCVSLRDTQVGPSNTYRYDLGTHGLMIFGVLFRTNGIQG